MATNPMTDEFVIESDIPRQHQRYPWRHHKYPWDKMQVGDSFAIDCDLSDLPAVAALRSKVHDSVERYNPEFKIETSTRNQNNNLRVWRIQ